MHQYQNILVHALVNLGDVLLSTSAVALLRQAYPGARITMMVRPAAAELVVNNPVIDEVIVYDYKSRHRSLRGLWHMVRLLKSKRFDLSVSLDRKLRPALLTWLARIPERVGPERLFDDKPSRVTGFYTKVISLSYDIINTLQVENVQEIVRGFTGAQGSADPVMADIQPENEAKRQRLFAELPLKKKKIALCVKGTFALKDWPQERFAALIDRLDEKQDAAFFVVGAPEDKAYADAVIAMTSVPVANFCGRTGLVDLAAVLKQSDLFITVDTGAAHIAATTGVPQVVIYGCTSPKRWHPRSARAHVLSSYEPCCPCSLAADACPEHLCMRRITVDNVVAVAEKTLSMTTG
ncbi:MAG TPA: glycosyltransferase family 9 protein [Patescibacteria group bacterium]|nr:glycosyltransferase family 9 protein [Patescibacteria group bacterium]